MKQIIAAALLSAGLSHCTERTTLSVPEAMTTDALIVRTGTSYGMCVGYCVNDYVLNSTTLKLTQVAPRTQAQNPTKTCETTISQSDWNAIKAVVDLDAFSKQPSTLGCPDCADGGAEYIELELSGRKHRVTFEATKTIPGFEPLVDALRKQRDSFKACP